MSNSIFHVTLMPKMIIFQKLLQFDRHKLFHQIWKNHRGRGTFTFIKSLLRYKQPCIRLNCMIKRWTHNMQRRIRNPVKYLRWGFLRNSGIHPSAILAKTSFLDILLGSQYPLIHAFVYWFLCVQVSSCFRLTPM